MVVDEAFPKGRALGSIEPAHDLRIGIHRQAVQRVFRKYHEVHGSQIARRNLATMDLVVFPEYALHGLSMDTNPEIMCRLDGAEGAAFRKGFVDYHIWGDLFIM